MAKKGFGKFVAFAAISGAVVCDRACDICSGCTSGIQKNPESTDG